jgi:hypothetical protein
MKIDSTILQSAIRDAVRDQLDALRLLSIPRAAELLDVSPETARKLLGHGVDVGGKGYKVRLEDVKNLIRTRTIKL